MTGWDRTVGAYALALTVTFAGAWADTPPPTAGANKPAGGGLSAEGSGLSAEGSGLSAASSGLGAYETELGTALTLSADVLFDFDKADLKPAALPMLRQLADLIARKKPEQVQIHGHTDGVGKPDYNQRLSQRRAEAVAAWLQQNGTPAAIVATKGFGASAPVAPNRKPDGSDNPDGRQKNRRVDVLLARQFLPITPLKPKP